MPNTLNIILAPVHRQMTRGDKQEAKLVLTKTGGDVLMGYHGEVKPHKYEGTWIQVCPNSLALDPIHPDHALVTLQLEVPLEAKHGYGEHHFTVQFSAESPSSDTTDVEIVIDVSKPWWLQWRVWAAIAIVCIVAAIIVALLVNSSRGPAGIGKAAPSPTAPTIATASAPKDAALLPVAERRAGCGRRPQVQRHSLCLRASRHISHRERQSTLRSARLLDHDDGSIKRSIWSMYAVHAIPNTIQSR